MKKYNTNINIRIEKELMEDLITIAESKGVKYSNEVRNLIRKYVEENKTI